MDDLEKMARAAELQILFNPNHEYKEELVEFREQVLSEREQLIQSMLEDERRFPDETPDMAAFEAELRLLDEEALWNKKHRCCKSHCCIYHGCKYGMEDCPVENEKTRQDGPCEQCSLYDNIQSTDEAVALSKGAADRDFLRELGERAAKYNNPVVDKFVADLYAESCVDPETNKESDDEQLWAGDW
jgi:hypothetical protein